MSSGDDRRTVLVVAGEYPPVKTIGRIRTAKFVEHLRGLGWRPVVLTVAAGPGTPGYDPALLREIPDDVPVYRAPWPDLEAEVVRRVKQMLGRGTAAPSSDVLSAAAGQTHSGAPTEGRPPAPSAPSAHAATGARDLPIRAFKWTLRNLIYVPDDYVTWARRAARLADRICAEHRVDVVYTSLPPFSACHVGHHVKRRHGVPWVLDYRDLWHGDVLRAWTGPLRRRLELALERRYVRAADVVIAVSEQKTEFLKRLHPKARVRWETLTNGYDEELYAPLLAEPRPVDDTLDFTFTGRLFKNRRGYAFAEALGQLVAERPALKSTVRVHILGGVAPEIRARYDAILAQYGITDLFDFPGDVSYQAAMRAQVQTDWLLLIVDTGDTSDGVIPGKLFEYVAARRPIFALTDPGATQAIIERAGIGVVVPAEDVDRCRAALARVLSEPTPRQLRADADYLSRFERKHLSQRLARVLAETVGAADAGRSG